MGLLDQFMAYMEANTPRNTRPAVSPLKVIDQGLLGSRIEQMPQRAEEIKQGLLRVPADLKQLGGPEMNQMVQGAYANPSPEGFDREKGMQMAMDFLQTSTPVGGLAGMFIGKGAKTWDALAAQQADDLLAKGIDPRDVWKQTGTLKGVDGALRQEIPDNEAKWLRNLPFEKRMEPMNNVIAHEELYAAYPETEKITALFGQNVNAQGGTGSYHFDPSLRRGVINIESGGSDAIKNAKSTGLHELQHAIQQREGWAKGGSTAQMKIEQEGASATIQALDDNISQVVKMIDEAAAAGDSRKVKYLKDQYDSLIGTKQSLIPNAQADAYEAYKSLAGEAEARLTESRMGLDAAQRRQHYPYDQGQYGLDVPLDSLIVRGLLNQ